MKAFIIAPTRERTIELFKTYPIYGDALNLIDENTVLWGSLRTNSAGISKSFAIDAICDKYKVSRDESSRAVAWLHGAELIHIGGSEYYVTMTRAGKEMLHIMYQLNSVKPVEQTVRFP